MLLRDTASLPDKASLSNKTSLSNKENLSGRIHSICSMSTKDGPGIRTVIFMQGCPLRCVYCHNPDTWQNSSGIIFTPSALMQKVARFSHYFGKEGGITFSGGEPLLQPEFLLKTVEIAKKSGIHTALDTAGADITPIRVALINAVDLIILDIKMTTEEDYQKYTGGSLNTVLEFLKYLNSAKKPVIIRQVIIPKINDNKENIIRLNELLRAYDCITKVELLPFRTLCTEKYAALSLKFPLEGTPDTDNEKLKNLQTLLEK